MNYIKYATNRKYRIFAKKIKDVDATIWDFEFKVAKSRQVREGVRQDRDRAVEAALHVGRQLEAKPAGVDLKKLESDKAALEDNAKRYEAQMKMVDEQINGVPAKGVDPGQQGILDTIASLVELREMYKSYLNTI